MPNSGDVEAICRGPLLYGLLKLEIVPFGGANAGVWREVPVARELDLRKT